MYIYFFPVCSTGKDIIGLAETGSGKTAAFSLPILQALLDSPSRLFALILTPTRYIFICVMLNRYTLLDTAGSWHFRLVSRSRH